MAILAKLFLAFAGLAAAQNTTSNTTDETTTTTTEPATSTSTAAGNTTTVTSLPTGKTFKVKSDVALAMSVPANATAASLFADTDFTSSVKTGLAAALGGGISLADINILSISFARRLSGRSLAAQTLQVEYEVYVADQAAAEAAYTVMTSSAFAEATKTAVNVAIAANPTLAGSYEVTAVTPGTPVITNAAGADVTQTIADAAAATPTTSSDAVAAGVSAAIFAITLF